MRILKYLSIGAIASAIFGSEAVAARRSAVVDGSVFTSVSQAVEFFATNSPAIRDRAYKYVENLALQAKGAAVLRLALGGLRTMSASSDDVSRYETFCIQNGLSCSNDINKVEWLSAFARTPSLSNAPESVAKQLEGILSQEKGLSAKVRLGIVKLLSEIYAVNMSDVERGIVILERFMEKSGGDETLLSSAMAKQMDIYRKVGRDSECEAKAKHLVGLASCPDAVFAAASSELARLASRRGDREKSGEFLADAIERCSYLPNGYSLQLTKVKAGTNAIDRAIAAIRRKIASVPVRDEKAFHIAVERWQPDLIVLLTYCGRGVEALGECRVWLFFAPQAKYQSAVELTAKTMKAVDGSLGRAIDFMNFQRKGAVPKGRNPMMEAVRLDDPERRSALDRLSELQEDRWSDLLALSRWMLWLDDPYASAEAAFAAFSVAPFSENALQSCANAIMRPVLVATRDPAAASQIVDFLMYGERGKDGRANTSDDAKNPLDAFGDALRTGGAR